jgi:hypothetical protein
VLGEELTFPDQPYLANEKHSIFFFEKLILVFNAHFRGGLWSTGGLPTLRPKKRGIQQDKHGVMIDIKSAEAIRFFLC